MRALSRAVTFISTLFVLGGCGGNNTLRTEDRGVIDAVSVAREVKLPKEPTVVGSAAGSMMLFGAAGGAAAAGSEKTDASNFAEFLNKSEIDVAQIVRQQFDGELKGHPFYGSRLSADGRYRFVLEVRVYGINKTNTFSTKWVTNLRIDYQLVSPDGKVLVQNWAMTTPFTDRPTFTEEEMLANPQILKQAFEKAAAEVCGKLIKRMG